MVRTMKAAVVHAFGEPLTIEEVDVPRLGAGDVLVKIEACGVCHTDLHAAEGDWPVKPCLPFIPGHEGVGHVIALGAEVGHVKEGDRVYLPLEDLGLIGDGATVALVGRNGSVPWLCVPRFDAEPLFRGLLDHAKGGYFSSARARAG
jgi:NADPH:quinone reductase-like Zn-dependent oxidoreductase